MAWRTYDTDTTPGLVRARTPVYRSRVQLRPLLSLPLALLACSKTAEPGALADFVAGPGRNAPACVAANDGKRFVVDGHLVTNGDVKVEDDRVDLYLAEAVADGAPDGKSFVVEARSGKHVDFAVSGVEADFRGGRPGSKGTLAGMTLHTDGGDASPTDTLGVVFDVEAIKHFQTGEITACVYHVVELMKR